MKIWPKIFLVIYRISWISKGHWRQKPEVVSGLYCGSIVIEKEKILHLKCWMYVDKRIITLLCGELGSLP